MRYLLIYNPVSGRENSRTTKLGNILMKLGKNGNELMVYQTQGKGDARRYLSLVREQYDMVIACGGDGTLHDVLNGVFQNHLCLPIGYIPLGSTNDFASGMGIHFRNAVELILRDCRKRVDVGRFNGEYFSYVAAFGTITSVSYSTPQNIKNSFGYMAYIIEGIKQITQMRSYRVRFQINQQEEEDDILIGIISNSLSVAGVKSKKMNPSLDDGMMEYLFIKKPNHIIDLQTVVALLLQEKYDEKYMYYGKTSALSLHFEEEVEWTLDGEFGGQWEEGEIETCPKKLEIAAGVE